MCCVLFNLPNMEIKTCTQNDIKDLIEVSTKSYLEHYTYLWFDNGAGYIKSSFNIDKIKAEMTDSNSIFFLIRDEQKFIGLIKLNIDSELDNFSTDSALELERIYFIKEASGKGYGKDAINFVVDFAKQKRKKVIWLKAMDSSPAVDFYKKRGFTITSETNLNYPGIRHEFKRMFLMRLAL
jgi:diamine N-acetyltransferase